MPDEKTPAGGPIEEPADDDRGEVGDAEQSQDESEVDDETSDTADETDFASEYSRQMLEPLRDAMRQITQPLADQVRRQQSDIARQFTTSFERQFKVNFVQPYLDQITKIQVMPPIVAVPPTWLSSFKALQVDFAKLVPTFTFDFSALRQGLLRACPPNWRDLDDSIQLNDLFDLTEAGFPTAWVPRSSVLEELARADETGRAGVFERHREVVIEDCTELADEITSDELAGLVVLLKEALQVAATGQLRAAQALAASVLDTTLRHTFQPLRLTGFYKRVKDEISQRHENASMAELRWGLAHIPVVVVLAMFDPSQGDPVPSNFNRHASAHAAGLVQYTPANAVVALALATSLLREAQQEIVNTAEDEDSTDRE
jgi:hypothetical protein